MLQDWSTLEGRERQVKVLDSAGHPSPEAVVAAGYHGVMGYVCDLPNPKAITPELAAAYRATGLAVGFVWENTANEALGGASVGARSGAEARRQLAACGAPSSVPVLGAIDFNVASSELATIHAYLTAGGFGGPYGSGLVCTSARQDGMEHTWQSMSSGWTGYEPPPSAGGPGTHCLYQTVSVVVGGVACDVSEVNRTDCLWLPPGAQASIVTEVTMATGYVMLAADGGTFAFGTEAAALFAAGNSVGKLSPGDTAVDLAITPTGEGYWIASAMGAVDAFGDAGFFGSAAGIHLNKPIVAIVSSPSGKGYWLFAADGGVFAYGDAPAEGSLGSIRLNAPVVSAVGI